MTMPHLAVTDAEQAALVAFNAAVKTCHACADAQVAMDDEYMDDHVAWCPEHEAQIYAWWDARRQRAEAEGVQ